MYNENEMETKTDMTPSVPVKQDVDAATCPASECCPNATPPITNADRIRVMTDEELARLLASNTDCNECIIYAYKDACMENYDTCVCQWLDWLRQEVEE